MSHPHLEVRELSCRLDGQLILDRVSFTVQPGECLIIIGPNGAGKSTLLRHLNGILPAHQGEVLIGGRSLREMHRREIARQMAYLPQVQQTLSPFTVEDTVRLSRYPYLNPFTSPRAEDEEVCLRVMEQVGVSHLRERLMSALSGGERQKVLLAAALAQEAPMLLLDEPTTFLDPRYQIEIGQLMADLHGQGKTLVVVTHDVTLASVYADRVLGLAGGRVVVEGTAGEVVTAETLRRLYGAEFYLVETEGEATLAVPRMGTEVRD